MGQETELRRLEVGRERTIEEAEIGRAVAVYEASLERAAAQARAAEAEARAVEAEEGVETAREMEAVERRRKVDLARAETAKDEARLAAEADRVRAEVEAEAARLVNEAENVLSDEARVSIFRRLLLERVEGIVAASVKPLEKINDIRIMQLAGADGGGIGGGGGSATDEVINSALRYRVQAPLIDGLLKDIGIEGGNLSKMGGLMREASDLQRVAQASGKAAEDDDKGGEGK